MISAEEAVRAADEAAQAEGWGRVDSQFHAVLAEQDGRSVWQVQRIRPAIGYDFWFIVDAESAAIVDKDRRGIR